MAITHLEVDLFQERRFLGNRVYALTEGSMQARFLGNIYRNSTEQDIEQIGRALYKEFSQFLDGTTELTAHIPDLPMAGGFLFTSQIGDFATRERRANLTPVETRDYFCIADGYMQARREVRAKRRPTPVRESLPEVIPLERTAQAISLPIDLGDVPEGLMMW